MSNNISLLQTKQRYSLTELQSSWHSHREHAVILTSPRLQYLSTSFLWRPAVAGTIGVKSRNALCRNAQCTGDTWRPCGTSTPSPSASRSACRVHAGVSRRASTAAPEAWHRSGTPLRPETSQWPHTRGEATFSLHMPRDARPARLSFCRLRVMASTHWILVGI